MSISAILMHLLNHVSNQMRSHHFFVIVKVWKKSRGGCLRHPGGGLHRPSSHDDSHRHTNRHWIVNGS